MGAEKQEPGQLLLEEGAPPPQGVTSMGRWDGSKALVPLSCPGVSGGAEPTSTPTREGSAASLS